MHRDRPAVQCMHTTASAGGGKGGAEQACREGSAGGAHLMREAINHTQSQACREGWAGGAHRLLQLEQSRAIKGNQGQSREIEGDRGRSHRLLQLEHATGLSIARLMRDTIHDVIRGHQRSSEVINGPQRSSEVLRGVWASPAISTMREAISTRRV